MSYLFGFEKLYLTVEEVSKNKPFSMQRIDYLVKSE